jgi:hypothetical protein
MTRLRNIPIAVNAMHRSHQCEPPSDFVGLPLEGLFQRLRIERDLARERAEAERTVRIEREAAEAAKRLAREAADRVSKIEDEAIFVVKDLEAFLATPLPGNDGRSSRELAAESTDGLRIVQTALNKMVDADRAAVAAERLRKDMLGKLWELVYARIPRRDVADLWPNQRLPELGGAKPIDYCKDKATLERCVEILDNFVKTLRKRGRR